MLATVDLLESAGFTKLAKREKAKALGTTFISRETVEEFREKLAENDQEFDIDEIKDYVPYGKEIIPVGEINKIAEVKKAGIFDKILVVGTRKLMEREVDPIVVGVLTDCDIEQCPQHDWTSDDWYFIAGWK